MKSPKVKAIVEGSALASLVVYCIMGSLSNGESLANPTRIQLAVEILVAASFSIAAILRREGIAAPGPVPIAPSRP